MDRVPRPAANHPAAVILLLAWLALATQASGQDQRPRFQAGVDITPVDVSVVDGNGRPVQGLTPADFNVRIGGAVRRVVTADWVPLTATADRAGSVAAIPDTFTSNLNATPGRIILIAIDQQNIRFGGAIPIRDALTSKDLAARALASSLVSSAVPIRVAAFAFGGQERGKVQLAVRAEIGEGYSSPVSMVVGYLLLGADGKVVDSRGVERELRPLTDGVPSPLQFAATISVEPGEYVLRVAATDGSRVGSAERKVSARLHEAGGLRTSDVIAGGPVYTTASLQPTVTSTVAFGNLHAFVEATARRRPARRSGSKWRARGTVPR